MKILGIEHIGIATESIDKIAPFWRQVLKLDRTHREIVEREGVITDIYDTGRGKVELLEQTGQESSIAKFLKKKRIRNSPYLSGSRKYRRSDIRVETG